MAKLKLELEELTVDTFGTEDTVGEVGTVYAHTGDHCISWNSCDPTCPDMGCDTGGWSCHGSTCAYSCYGTCGGWTCAGSGCNHSAATSPCICF